jgi:arylsulfatase A-like enzyme
MKSEGTPVMAHRRCGVLFLLAVLLAFGPAPLAAPQDSRPSSERPNIVFILIDDLGWSDLGCTGSRYYETPNIDRLAGQGMRFTDAYAAAPLCSPTRASILTGKYPARLQLTDVIGRKDRDGPHQALRSAPCREFLPLEEVTIPKALKPQGYVSACIGKWHLGGEGYLPENHGFDLNLGATEQGTPPGGYFKFSTPTLQLRPGEYLTDRLTDEAEKFMEANRTKPFFLYLPHYAVHAPFQGKPELVAKYQAKAKPFQDQAHPSYAAMIESADQSVGRILKKLDELELAQRTIVFFFSDNGGLSFNSGRTEPATSNAPLREGKGSLYEGGIRVPLIVRWPGVIKPGIVCEVPVSSIDFYPTILDLSGTARPSGHSVDGQSLLPLLKQEGTWAREALYWHYPHYNGDRLYCAAPCGAVRKGDFKLIEYYDGGKLELYNLKEHVGERHEVSTVFREKTVELHELLKTWRRDIGALMPTPNPEFRPQDLDRSPERKK